jgi:predicted GH43/DUF377 family glycosyl hydrolase
VIPRPFLPGTHGPDTEPGRLASIIDRILALPENDRDRLLTETRERSKKGYGHVEVAWLRHFGLARDLVPSLDQVVDDDLQLLIGAFLTQGYAYEAAALTNPSMVPVGPPSAGAQSFIMSARAIGEGHISSIAFFTGSVDATGTVVLDPRSEHVSNGIREFGSVRKESFAPQLKELDLPAGLIGRVLDALQDRFTKDDLNRSLDELAESDVEPADAIDAISRVRWLAASNYDISFDASSPISEHLLSPAIPIESNGMEDARFVRFLNDDGSVTYYATYTAFDGRLILPQLIETTDFHHFRIGTLTGPAVHHKGMAIFPRKIEGEYVSLSRHDHEKSFLMRSDNIHTWSNAEVIAGPERPWELIQTGNCGSPIETEAGWLVITHGVGPMRRYVLGAVLLDLDEPAKVLARLDQPLIEPEPTETAGYVPDVVYSCGSMVHNGFLVLPYGYSDHGIRVVVTQLGQVLDRMT